VRRPSGSGTAWLRLSCPACCRRGWLTGWHQSLVLGRSVPGDCASLPFGTRRAAGHPRLCVGGQLGQQRLLVTAVGSSLFFLLRHSGQRLLLRRHKVHSCVSRHVFDLCQRFFVALSSFFHLFKALDGAILDCLVGYTFGSQLVARGLGGA
jgi:hypothetical protein